MTEKVESFLWIILAFVLGVCLLLYLDWLFTITGTWDKSFWGIGW